MSARGERELTVQYFNGAGYVVRESVHRSGSVIFTGIRQGFGTGYESGFAVRSRLVVTPRRPVAELGDDFPCCTSSPSSPATEHAIRRMGISETARACLDSHASSAPRCVHCAELAVRTELGWCHDITGLYSCTHADGSLRQPRTVAEVI